MCRSDWLDKTERKYKKPPAEIAEDDQATNIHNSLVGQLFQGEEYIIKNLGRKEQ